MPGIPGDPGAIEAAADELVAAGEQFTEARDSLAGHLRGGLARWSGVASGMASVRLEQYADRNLVGADACRDAAPPLRTFAAQLRLAQQEHAAAEAQLAAGQARVDGARPGVVGDGARAYGQEMVADAQAAMAAAWERVRRAAEVAGSQIDVIVDLLAEMQAEPPGGGAAPPAAPADEGSSGSDGVHLALDGLGFAGPLGPFADFANAGLYLIEGDWTDALISGAAAVPLAGDAFKAGKLGAKGLDATRGADEVAAGARAGPGGWTTARESMSDRAAAYQSQITGAPPGTVYKVGTVRFDGYVDGVLHEAKGPGYANFVKDGEFQGFFHGQDTLIDQANRQSRAASGTPIVWSVAEPEAVTAIANLLRREGIPGIDVVHVPPAR